MLLAVADHDRVAALAAGVGIRLWQARRAVGPGLTQFGVTGILADPQLSLVPLGKDFAVAANDNWGGTAALQAAFAQAGAFALPAGGGDALLFRRGW